MHCMLCRGCLRKASLQILEDTKISGFLLQTLTFYHSKCRMSQKVYCNHRKQELQNKVAYLHKRLQRMESELANCG